LAIALVCYIGYIVKSNLPSADDLENVQIGTLPPTLPDPNNYQYYGTLEEAVANNTLETSNVTYINEKIKLFENDKFAVLFFKSNVHGKDTLYAFKFFVREIDGTPHYSPPIVGANIMWAAHILSVKNGKLDELGEVRLSISRDSLRLFRIDDTKNFFWGISQSENAKKLKIEGQPATEVIEINMDGNAGYFWYFDDLKTTKEPIFQSLTEYKEGDFIITMD